MRLFDELRLDLRYAVRTMARTPGFAAVVILSLGLGIGANSAIFTLADAVLLRPLPVRAPDELADIYTQCSNGDPYCVSSYPDFEDYRRNNRTFSDMAAFSPLRVSLSGQGVARFVDGMLVFPRISRCWGSRHQPVASLRRPTARLAARWSR